MSYIALYRKWRPHDFGEVKGQDAIVTTLKNQITADRVGHAYLFCGSRGTGKTTVAKIFAQAVNCLEPVGGSPCGKCSLCEAVAAGNSVNVIEIDAASNNGVDSIREIRDEVQYRPAQGRYRVYIIDEVHMLSTGAFNALLKTLEEPPAYVIFILATTDPNKIPLTVLSRCQRYDFRRITVEDIVARLTELAAREGVTAEDKALAYIARKADGALRDAISLLDQCMAFHMNEELTYEKALKALGTVDSELLSRFLRALMASDTTAALQLIEEVRLQGRELGQFVQDFIWYLRNLLLLMAAEATPDILEISKEDWLRLQEEGRQVSPEELMRYIRLFSSLYNDMRGAADKRVLLEVASIKATRPAMEQDQEALLDRISRLEKRLESGTFTAPAAAVQAAPEKAAPAQEEAPARKKLSRAQWEDLQLITKDWKKLLRSIDYLAAKSLEKIWLEPKDGGVMSIVFPHQFDYNMAQRFGALDLVREKVGEMFGRTMSFDARVAGQKEQAPEYITDEELSKVHMEIDVEDN